MGGGEGNPQSNVKRPGESALGRTSKLSLSLDSLTCGFCCWLILGFRSYLYFTLQKSIQALMLRQGDANFVSMGKSKDMLRYFKADG